MDICVLDISVPDIGVTDIDITDISVLDHGFPDNGVSDIGITDISVPDFGFQVIGVPNLGVPIFGITDFGKDLGLPDDWYSRISHLNDVKQTFFLLTTFQNVFFSHFDVNTREMEELKKLFYDKYLKNYSFEQNFNFKNFVLTFFAPKFHKYFLRPEKSTHRFFFIKST